MLPIGLDNLNLIPEEARKAIYDASRKPPEGYETKANQISDNNKDSVRSQVFNYFRNAYEQDFTFFLFCRLTNGVLVALNLKH